MAKSSETKTTPSKYCKTCQFHAVLFPFMSKGHTIPLLHLTHLLLRRGAAITVLTTPANHPFIANFLSNTSASIINLPFHHKVPDIPSGIESVDKLPSISLFPLFALSTKLIQPHFEAAVHNLRPVNFIVSDGFLWWTAESASKLGVPRLVFTGMSNYSSCLAKSVAVHEYQPEPKSDDDRFTLTEFPWIKLTKNDFDPVFLDPKPGCPHAEFVSKVVTASSLSYGSISNSFYELEPVFVDHFSKYFKLWCVGPLCLASKPPSNSDENQKKPTWIQWLDQKKNQGDSVLYVAFGSQAELSADQIREIANGLEQSEVNFLWILRKQEMESEIRDGFEDRVKERGVIVSGWVDQMEILKHESVKGFLSHCGWNSVLESVCSGVPILAWPVMAEQPLNARMVVEEVKVGLRVETCDGSIRGFVKSEGLKKMVRELMVGDEGNQVRKNVQRFSEMAKRAMEEGSGSSWCSLDRLINEICNGKHGRTLISR